MLKNQTKQTTLTGESQIEDKVAARFTCTIYADGNAVPTISPTNKDLYWANLRTVMDDYIEFQMIAQAEIAK